MDYHVWGAMLEAYYKLHPKPNSITELEALQVIWDSLPHDHMIIKAVISSHYDLKDALTLAVDISN